MNLVLGVLGYLTIGVGILLIADTILIYLVRKGQNLLERMEEDSNYAVDKEATAEIVGAIKEIQELRENIFSPKKTLWMILTWPSAFVIGMVYLFGKSKPS